MVARIRKAVFDGDISTAALWVLLGLGMLCMTAVVTVDLDLESQAIFAVGSIIALFIMNRWKGHAMTVALAVLSCTVSTRYIWWRLTSTLEFDSVLEAALGTGLFLAEIYAWLALLLGFVQTVWPLERKPVSMPEDEADWPTVDVYVPTYNESLAVVRNTVLGALAMDYPRDKFRVYLLDDGRREEFREFAAECGAGYIIRADNTHAKAGNLNNALKVTDGELIAIFDCDHVPTRAFLQMAVGWFLRDDKLALVQTPHHFYSPDPFERNLSTGYTVPNEGQLFYGLIQEGNDFWNASFFCGSCAVVKREALESIGGFAVETVTEDAHTALKMHRKGWHSAYLKVPMAAGLATERLALHMGQRMRWARGMTQIFRLDNPLLGPGLTLGQRLCYLNAMFHFFFALPRFVFLTAPLAYLLFQQNIIAASALAILAYAGPHLVHATITNSRIQSKFRYSFWGEIYESVLTFYLLKPTLMTLINPRRGTFNVTEKGGLLPDSYFDYRIIRPQLILGAVLVFGFVIGILRLLFENLSETDSQVLLLNMAWATFNLITLGAAIAVAREAKQVRNTVRVAVRVPATIFLPDGRTIVCESQDLSMGGGQFAAGGVPEGVAKGQPVDIELPAGLEKVVVPARIVTWDANGPLRVMFDASNVAEYRRLVRVIFGRADAWVHWDAHPEDRPLRSVTAIFTSIGAVLFWRGGLFKGGLSLRKRAPAGTGVPVAPQADAVASAAVPVSRRTWRPWRRRSRDAATAALLALAVALPALAPDPAAAQAGNPTGSRSTSALPPGAVAQYQAQPYQQPAGVLPQAPPVAPLNVQPVGPQAQQQVPQQPGAYPQPVTPEARPTVQGTPMPGQPGMYVGQPPALNAVQPRTLDVIVPPGTRRADTIIPGPVPGQQGVPGQPGQRDSQVVISPMANSRTGNIAQRPPLPKPLQAATSATAAQSTIVEAPKEEVGSVRHETLTLEDLGAQTPMRLLGVDDDESRAFSVRRDEVVTGARVKMNYAYSTALIPELSHLYVVLNNEVVGSVQLTKELSAGNTVEFPIAPVLFQEDNRLMFRFVGHYTLGCEDPLHSTLWALVSNTSTLEMTKERLPLRNDLSLLPLPFFDRKDMKPLVLPFVMAASPSLGTLEAAGVVSSWFGQLASYRTATFPVSFGSVPQGNAVIFATSSQRPSGLTLPAVSGPTLAVVPNPYNPDSRLLLVLGQNDEQLKAAARTLALGANALSGPTAMVGDPAMPTRQPNDAPNWIPTDRPIRLGELVSPLDLQGNGLYPGTLTVNFQTAPGIFAWRDAGIPLNVRYRYPAGTWLDYPSSRLDVLLNNSYLKSLPLIADTTMTRLREAVGGDFTVNEANVSIPPFLVTGKNQLQFFYNLKPIKEECKGTIPDEIKTAIDPDSMIDFSHTLRYTPLPNLAFFVNSGYPFSRMADLSETAVVLPDRFRASDIESYLAMMGLMGDTTGYFATRVQVVTASQVQTVANKDLLVIGSFPDQPLVGQWASTSPFRVEGNQLRVRMASPIERLYTILDETNRERERKDADELLMQTGADLAGLISFESPMNSGRTVVMITGARPEAVTAITTAIRSKDLTPQVQGDLVVLKGNKLSSYRVGTTFTQEALPFWTRLRWYFADKPFVLLAFLLLGVILLSIATFWLLKRISIMRGARAKA